MQRSSIVKLNHDELLHVRELLGFATGAPDDPSFCRLLISKFDLQLACVTYGAEGSLLCNQAQENRHPGFKVVIKDTVGAGDAFTAGLAHGVLNRQSLAETNELANRMGAWVASCSGAMPPVPKAGLLQTLISL